jgi:1-acyl-sn-glycerol-3-phosphate acyltransferase
MADLVYPPVVVTLKTLWRYLGLRFTFEGQENIPASGGAILAMNHVGYLDFALIGTGVLPRKRYVRFMAKKSIFDHKIAGPLMRGMHHISVDRDSGSASFVAALRALRAGEIVGIFPEATISRSFEIKEMKTGAIRLAQGAGVPIIPTIIWGSQRIYTKGIKPDFSRKKIPISVSYGPPLHVSKGDDALEAEAELRRRMEALLRSVQEKYPDSPVGQFWAPARLGGTAPTPLQIELEHQRHNAPDSQDREED